MSTTIANPRSLHYEFGGPLGALFVSTSVPFFTYFFALSCNHKGCPPWPIMPHMQAGLAGIDSSRWWKELYDHDATLVYLAWYAFTVIAWAVLPGKWVKGVKLRNGAQLDYKINAFTTFIVTLLGSLAVGQVYGLNPFLWIFDHWVGLVTASILMSVTQAFYVYSISFAPKTMLALGGNTGNPLYDWFIGRGLNPRIGLFDIKSFNELRPGIILWFVLNLANAAKQYSKIGRITDSMVLVVVFQTIYIVDALYNEVSILTTMDITTDGFGFMLSVGDLVWVPFTYGLQTRFLALYPKDLGVLGTSAVVAVNALGYYVFRSANKEKDDFRNGRNPKNLTYMKTDRGTNLLTSGWWGRSRHPNYLGDWIMAWAWCLPTGFTTPMTYFYVIYFAILLVHRQLRDDEACKIKYGKDWDKYCKLVPYKIVPYVY